MDSAGDCFNQGLVWEGEECRLQYPTTLQLLTRAMALRLSHDEFLETEISVRVTDVGRRRKGGVHCSVLIRQVEIEGWSLAAAVCHKRLGILHHCSAWAFWAGKALCLGSKRQWVKTKQI